MMSYNFSKQLEDNQHHSLYMVVEKADEIADRFLGTLNSCQEKFISGFGKIRPERRP